MDYVLYVVDAATTTLDPAFDAHVLPMESLTLAGCERWQPREWLSEAVLLAKEKVVQDGVAVWSNVTGPIGGSCGK